MGTTAIHTSPENRIRDVLAERCRIAGGARAGFSLRRTALQALASNGGEIDEIEAAVDALVAAGRLAANESNSRVYLTEAGVAWLSEEPAAAPPTAG